MKKTSWLHTIIASRDSGLSPVGIHQKINDFILKGQYRTGRIYNDYFTFKAALIFALVAGACFAFTGDDCYGKVGFSSPMIYCLFLITVFFFFQTFVLVPLSLARLLRLMCTAVCGHYLAYQLYGFWSLENVKNDNLCRPYTYADITYGYIWLFIPPMLLVMIAFFSGSRTDNL